jgi:hypothetical protein
MSDSPAPLTPADCDLRGMPYMPVEVVRLFDSALYVLSTGDEFKAAFTLWGKAFLQVPAGSLPDDERMLAHLSGAGSRWAKVRSMALRGWVRCSDGRLYHPVVAEKASEAWQARLAQRARTEAARQARAAKRQDSDIHAVRYATCSVTENATDNATGSKGREGKGREEIEEEVPPLSPKAGPEPRRAERAAVCADLDFDRFWNLYPRKIGKGAARKAWATAVKRAEEGAMSILGGITVQTSLDRFDTREGGRFIPHPSTWLNGDRWLDGMEADEDEPDLLRRSV